MACNGVQSNFVSPWGWVVADGRLVRPAWAEATHPWPEEIHLCGLVLDPPELAGMAQLCRCASPTASASASPISSTDPSPISLPYTATHAAAAAAVGEEEEEEEEEEEGEEEGRVVVEVTATWSGTCALDAG